MKIVVVCHSFVSCWNNGNAHFLRGLARELLTLGHDVVIAEPADGWSRSNAVQDGGAPVLREAAHLVPDVQMTIFDPGYFDADELLDQADLVLVHEWTDPDIVIAIGRARRCGGQFTLLFHDTHHRRVTSPKDIAAAELTDYDGVIAFGESLRADYDRAGWGRRAFTLHEAADVVLFKPLPRVRHDTDVIWIGNWGDGERTSEIDAYFIDPVRDLRARAVAHGVRYPSDALARLDAAGIEYRGWLANHRVPEAFAHARVTVHIPRRPYAGALAGIPTIRVFEALACGIPLVCAPWADEEKLFPSDCFALVSDGRSAQQTISALLNDQEYGRHLAARGLETILARHTCAHRARELLSIAEALADRPTCSVHVSSIGSAP